MLSLVLKSDTLPGRVLTSLPASEDPSSERRKTSEFHEIHMALGNVAKGVVVKASTYLREESGRRSRNGLGGFPNASSCIRLQVQYTTIPTHLASLLPLLLEGSL